MIYISMYIKLCIVAFSGRTWLHKAGGPSWRASHSDPSIMGFVVCSCERTVHYMGDRRAADSLIFQGESTAPSRCRPNEFNCHPLTPLRPEPLGSSSSSSSSSSLACSSHCSYSTATDYQRCYCTMANVPPTNSRIYNTPESV